jgi:hypothetical protein
MSTPAGNEFTWRLLFDSLTVLHTEQNGPTFVDARDAILEALQRRLGGPPANDPIGQVVLRALLARGLGPNATSAHGGFSGIVEHVG